MTGAKEPLMHIVKRDGVSPFSYTHLDVYKRQMYRRKYSTKFTEAGQPFVKGLAQLSPFMTSPELQAYLHICRRTAYTLVHQEGFPAYRVGRSIRIDRKELELSLIHISC